MLELGLLTNFILLFILLFGVGLIYKRLVKLEAHIKTKETETNSQFDKLSEALHKCVEAKPIQVPVPIEAHPKHAQLNLIQRLVGWFRLKKKRNRLKKTPQID